METSEYIFTKTLRPAKRDDFANGKDLIVGAIYFVKSPNTGAFEGPYSLKPHSDLKIFAQYLKDGVLWVETFTSHE